MAEVLHQSLETAVTENSPCLIVRLDTPGGLMKSMRMMVMEILASEVPVVIYVAPAGSQCASAGVFLTMAAHVAAMAPGTNLGAAHPVTMGGRDSSGVMLEKITNDAVAYLRSIATQRQRNADWAEEAVRRSVSITAQEALELGVVDLLAANLDDLLEKLEGREVMTATGPVTLHTSGLELVYLERDWRGKLLEAITDPNVAYILMLLGIYGLFFELYHPGVIDPAWWAPSA